MRNAFDGAAARRRCLAYRRRILDMSQQVTALHIAPAFSCLEMVDAVYRGLMRRADDGEAPRTGPVNRLYRDSFVLSKGHGCLAQYVVLADLGVLAEADLQAYCTPDGRLGAHPDFGVPGTEAATGSLGHGLAMAVGIAYAAKISGTGETVYCLLSDGELQEGSTWEAAMAAANLGLDNLVALVDLNDRQSLGQTSETHPAFYPVGEKFGAFGWGWTQANGHDAEAVVAGIADPPSGRPFCLIGNTVKGRGVAYMENVPIWHYRAPSAEEYRVALDGLREVAG